MQDKLVTKVNIIDTSRFVWKSQHNSYKSGLEKKIESADTKIPDTSELIKKNDYNAKTTEIKSKIPIMIG